jgi:hypothetical protein
MRFLSELLPAFLFFAAVQFGVVVIVHRPIYGHVLLRTLDSRGLNSFDFLVVAVVYGAGWSSIWWTICTYFRLGSFAFFSVFMLAQLTWVLRSLFYAASIRKFINCVSPANPQESQNGNSRPA